jgi:mannose-6-phosphate isomerase-like protein (cupin superfamily)
MKQKHFIVKIVMEIKNLIKPNDMNYVSKPWGWELWICNNEKYCGKKIFIKQGHHLSYHHHKIKDEVLFIESGKIIFTHDEYGSPQSIEISSGYAYHVKPETIHQMKAIEDTIIFEFSTTHSDEDSYRTTRDLVIAEKIKIQDL